MNEKGLISISQLLQALEPGTYRILGTLDRSISLPAPIDSAEGSHMTFCSKKRGNVLESIRGTAAALVFCPDDLTYQESDYATKTLVLVKTPRLVFMRLVQEFFAESPSLGIHPTAVIAEGTEVSPTASIGAFTFIDSHCKVGENTVIHGHVYVYPKTRIGKNITIHAGTVIGVDGFGYERSEDGELERFPSIGGVIIEDDVEIHSNVNIDRGTLEDTIIGQGTKIDKFCHIGHNVIIGKHCVITAHSMLGGSARIGDYTWIAPCVCIRDGGIQIGSRALVGMASVVTKDVPAGATVMGAPARPADEHKRILQVLHELVSHAL